jgi:hypothetical protein
MNQTRSKFKLYGFDGNAKKHYIVTTEKLNLSSSPKEEIKPGHSIIVVDRSGSMYGDIGALKDMLIKLLTLEEYNNSSMLTSLVSYSTNGDCTTHFDHVPVREVMKLNSPQQEAIKRIRSTGLTCISQAMKMAMELVRNDEPTAIILHSDGYANDPSTWSEQKSVATICDKFKGKNVFVNTVAYSSYSDFSFLSSIANWASGKCVRADSVKEVYDSLHESLSAVNGDVAPQIVVSKGEADYVTFVSKSKRRVNGGSLDLTVAGLSDQDDATVYRYYESTEDEYNMAQYPVNQHGIQVLAFSRAKLSEGRLNDSKFAAYSSCVKELNVHLKALTGPQLAAMASDLDDCLFPSNDKVFSLLSVPETLSGSVTVSEVLTTLEKAREGIMLNLKRLTDNYHLRGVKRIPGTRTGDTVESPWLELEFIDSGEWVPMGSFDFNRNNASINMLITRPSRLVKVADHKPISEIAGINVASLPSFRNYTIVGDGEVVTKELGIKFGSKSSFDLVNSLGVLEDGAVFDQSEHIINLDKLPVTSFNFNGELSGMKTAYREILGDKVVVGILSAITKETSATYTADQLSELKRHYLSGSLNINFPSTTEYDDLDVALKDGQVDTRVSYKVDIGDKGILSSSDLFSANAFLARHFMAGGGASASDKPTWPLFLEPKVTFQSKPPSAKMKLTEVDTFCRPIFEEFLGLAVNGSVRSILKKAGIDKSVMDIVRGGVEMMTEVNKKLEDHMEKTYRDNVMPFVFFVGATGLLPDCFDVKGMSADELEAQITGLKLGKDMKEGTFFVLGDMVISVYARNEYFSTGRVLQKAQ